jgi:hypothetical protein
MAFDAGAVVGHVNLDGSQWVNGAKQVTRANSSMWASIFKGNLAYDAFKKTLNAVISVGKDCIQSFVEQEQAEAQMNATLRATHNAAGMTSKALLDLAGSLQATTTYGDETILAAENILLTFKSIGKDVFPDATKAITDVATALKMDLTTAARTVGRALENPTQGMQMLRRYGIMLTDSQKETVKHMMAVNDTAGAQRYILKLLEGQYGGSAVAARDTFGGAMKSLDNYIGEVKETIGKYITTAARPLVESFIDVAKQVNEFLMSKQGMQEVLNILQPLAGGFAVAWEMGKQLWDLFKNFAAGVLDSVKRAFTSLFGEAKETGAAFSVLGVTMKVIAIAFTIAGRSINFVLTLLVDLVKVAVSSYETMARLGDAMLHPWDRSKWEAVGNSAMQTWDKIKTTGVDAFNNISEMVKTVMAEFKDFNTDVKTNSALYEKRYTMAVKNVQKAFENFLYTSDKTNGEVAQGAEETSAAVAKSWKTTFDELKTQMDKSIKEYGLWSDQAKIDIDAVVNHVLTLAQSITGTLSNITSQVSGVISQYYENELTAAENDYQARKEYIEANVSDETERDAQLTQLDEDYAKKVANIKKQQFEATRATNIASAVMSTAQAVMTTYAQFGWPWGLIPAAIVAGLGAAQVALIASQETPSYAAKGGVFTPGTNVVVGERGPELITLGQTSRVVPNEVAFGASGGVDMDVNFYGDIASDVDLDSATSRMARKVKAAMRAA